MTNTKRNTGIDLLKNVSMIMIVILHVLGRGGILNKLSDLSLKHGEVWFLEIAAYCAVNCYALISGYICFGRNIKLKNIFSLWIQVAFYLFTINIVFKVFNLMPVSIIDILKSFIPVTCGQYWYFSSYFAIFFFIPFFNYLIDNLSFRKATVLIVALVGVFSVLPIITLNIITGVDVFKLGDGYSPLWLAILYIIGAYLKKYNIASKINTKKLVIGYFVCVIITFLVKITFEYLSKIRAEAYYLNNIFVSYVSPSVLICSICLLLAFSKISTHEKLRRIIQLFSTTTFGVYIIHRHPLIWECLHNRFTAFVNYNPLLLPLAVIGTALGIWLACSVVEIIRIYLFKLLRIEKLINKVSDFCAKQINKLVDNLALKIQ